jgi:transposase-like protein
MVLPTDWSALPREQRLKLWLRGEGLTLAALAQKMGVHKSAPGKWLIQCCEPLPKERRQELQAMGMPDVFFHGI